MPKLGVSNAGTIHTLDGDRPKVSKNVSPRLSAEHRREGLVELLFLTQWPDDTVNANVLRFVSRQAEPPAGALPLAVASVAVAFVALVDQAEPLEPSEP